MKAAVIPGINAAWELREVPTPVPGPGEVLVRVAACGMCVNDVDATRGYIPFPSFEPAITGHEPVGTVVELGPGVTSRQVGDVVGTTWIRGTCGRCDYCRLELPLSGQAAFNCAAPTSTGFTVQGGHAEYLAVAARETVLIPDGLAPELAAPVLCAGYTALSALRAGEPAPGERVAVLGIGALGHLAVQFARAAGFETIAITSSPDKRDLAVDLGAAHVVGSGAELREIGGADVVLVTAPSYAAASESLQGLRVNGRLVLAGIDGAEPFTIPPAVQYPFFAQRNRIIGATHDDPRYLREALDLVAAGAVTPMVEVFPAEQVQDAVEKVGKREVRFRAVITY
ncbi:alcohol dehydrogenase/propanol-preferring alcohol dehydrogenase [Actinokineospora baliensis]|uniref:alcohol dehydrogenase catalytic domain-containing protein n=1 Tax=Actinokineospora baliensis TaxID=547056 RepID=UPI00195846B1|nr:alcohol dehydrogenase catalytic domain-containing protein [Actinokineospora baliensis]MBM7774550.1 alcohol dehydrogenase/propanol-preferring alcohol dehydrogenase [Actinokineospora baliensis]